MRDGGRDCNLCRASCRRDCQLHLREVWSMSKERKALGPEPPKAFIEVDGEERELPGPVKFDLKPSLYKNNWPEDYAPAFNLDFNALTLAVQSLNESFYEWAKPLVGALSQFADTFNEHFR